MRPSLNERQNRIWDLIQLGSEVKIGDLKERFDVTEMTIRRDLEKLEGFGLVRRTFGGAIPVTGDVSLKDRNTVRLAEKIRIGRAAAALVKPGQAVFIDGGTTTFQVARHLQAGSGITVVTNALNVAVELMEKGIPTLMTGGMLVEQTVSLVGPMAVYSLQNMAFDQTFLGTTGFNAAHGFSNSNALEAELKRKAIRQAESVTVVADGSKFGGRLLHSFASLADVNRLVTDAEPPAGLAAAARESGLEVVIA